jgi:HK97 family phage portal protein
MSFIDKIKEVFSQKQIPSPPSQFTTGPLWELYQYRPRMYEQDLLNYRYAKSYNTHEGIYAIVSMLAQKFSSFPVYVYEIKDLQKFQQYKAMNPRTFLSGSNMERSIMLKNLSMEVVVENDLSKILEYPNQNQSFAELLENYYGYKLIFGEADLWLNTGGISGGRPLELQVIPPPMLGVLASPNNMFAPDGYYIRQNGFPVMTVEKDDIIMWKYFNPVIDDTQYMHLRGLSPLTAAQNILENSIYANKAGGAMYQNNGAKGALFAKSLPRTMTRDQIDGIMFDVNQRINNNNQKGAVAAFGGDWGYHDLGMSSIDMQLLDAQRLSLQRLCNIYNVPTVLFDAEHTTYNNYESAIKQLVVNKLLPEWNSLRALLNKQLTPRFARNGRAKLYIDFDFTELPEIQKDLKELNDSVRDAHWLTYNERRAVLRYGARPEPEMNQIFIPTGYIPITEMNSLATGPLDNSDDSFPQDSEGEGVQN